jgi:hypothetical protein
MALIAPVQEATLPRYEPHVLLVAVGLWAKLRMPDIHQMGSIFTIRDLPSIEWLTVLLSSLYL